MALATAPVGALLRDWRQRRRLSQLDLASAADVSTRHLSFIETGRSKPSRELLVHLARHLDVPVRERNTLLLAGGYAPAYGETPLDDHAMNPVREALDKILAGHEPYPAVIVNRHWDLVAANRPALAILTEGVAAELLSPPVNALRVTLHPGGLAPRIANLDEWSAHLLGRLRREATASGDPSLTALHEELRSYPGVVEDAGADVETAAASLYVTLRLRPPAVGDGGELALFSTVATFGTALDVTLAELSIESFFPADEATAAALRG
jgi:transcriptional regulator with XRE-family HTH domain